MAKYTVKTGDSWSKIAGNVYGGQQFFNVLMNANSGVGVLQPGMVITVPDISGYQQQLQQSGEDHYVGPDDVAQAALYNQASGYDGPNIAFQAGTAPNEFYQQLLNYYGIDPTFTDGTGGTTTGGAPVVGGADPGYEEEKTTSQKEQPVADAGGTIETVPGQTYLQAPGGSNIPDPTLPSGYVSSKDPYRPVIQAASGAPTVAPSPTGTVPGSLPTSRLSRRVRLALAETGLQSPTAPGGGSTSLYPTLSQYTVIGGDAFSMSFGSVFSGEDASQVGYGLSSSQRRATAQTGDVSPYALATPDRVQHGTIIPRTETPARATTPLEERDLVISTSASAQEQRANVAALDAQLLGQKPLGTYGNWHAIENANGTVTYVRRNKSVYGLPFNASSDQGAYVALQPDGSRIIGGGDGLPDLDITAGTPKVPTGGGFGNTSGGVGGSGGSGGFTGYSGYGGGGYTPASYQRPSLANRTSPNSVGAVGRQPSYRSGGGFSQRSNRPVYRNASREYRAFLGAVNWRLF